MSNLRGTNLNLLPVLRELLRKRNVTHAARALNMSQPAVSEALGRIRRLFHDEILIADGRTLVPSALAERLAPRLEASLGDIETLIAPASFAPEESVGTIKIATADYVTLLLGSEFATRLARAAPNLRLEFREADTRSAYELRMGQIDLIIRPDGLPSVPIDDFRQAPLFEDDLVCIVDADADYQGGLENFLAGRNVLFTPSDSTLSFAESILRQRGNLPFDAVRVPNFLLIPFLVEGTDNIALIQRRLAERMLPAANIRIVEPPFEFPTLRIVMAWNRARQHDPAHMWFRELLIDIAHGPSLSMRNRRPA